MFLLYMDEINPDPFTNGSISTIIEDGLAYYMIPKDFRFFRAKKGSRYNIDDEFSVLTLNPGAFFGVYNMDRDYIESYEDTYGVIFAFETTRPYKLLALDHPTTKMALYSRVPENIQRILRINYGYPSMSGNRESELNSDLVLSKYLCDKGYQGYATNSMKTDDIGGEFHPEFMICDVGGIKSIGRITNDPRRIASIVESGILKKHSEELEAERQEKRKNRQRPESPPHDSTSDRFDNPTSHFASYGSPRASYGSPVASYGSPGASYSSPFAPARVVNPFASYASPVAPSRFANPTSSGIPKLSFGDMDDEDDDDNKENSPNRKGGLRKGKRRSYKKRKTRTNKRKRSIRRKKGTRRRR